MGAMVAAAKMSPSAVTAALAEVARAQEIHWEASPARALAWRVVGVLRIAAQLQPPSQPSVHV